MGVQPKRALGTYRWTPYYNKMAGGEKGKKGGGKEEERNEKERGKFICRELRGIQLRRSSL